MNMYDIIHKKREGGVLSAAELNFWLTGAVNGAIPDYQSAALLMAICWRGLNQEETVSLTITMRDSGAVLDLRGIAGVTADKHSTGGVGDKTSLVVAPLAAAAGLKMVKMSGRGLGFTGGTLDKLESIPGFRVDLTQREFTEQIRSHGLALAGQTAELAPADKLLYSLRDATATVESLPLIAASIMSKKLAVGAEVLALDVKYGSGAFMKDIHAARELALMMAALGRAAGQRVTALITSMEQPLGYAVGNAVEVREAMAVLQGQGPADVRELALAVTAELLLLSGLAASREEGLQTAAARLDDGAAWQKFCELVAAQGGDPDFTKLPQAPLREPFAAEAEGYIWAMDCELVGRSALALGAGRLTKEAAVDHAAGLVLCYKTGDYVRAGQTIAVLHGRSREQIAAATELLRRAVVIAPESPLPQPLIAEIL